MSDKRSHRDQARHRGADPFEQDFPVIRPAPRKAATTVPICETPSVKGTVKWFNADKGLPAAIVQKLNRVASTVVDTPSVQAKLQEIGATVVTPERRSPAYLQAFVESEIKKWAEPIKAANLTLN